VKSSLDIIRRPLVTEKVTRMQETLNQYAFEVEPSSNKIEIRKAVEERFSVKVKKVRTISVRGKMKTLGRFSGRRPNWKKAIVTLAEGESIDLFEGGA